MERRPEFTIIAGPNGASKSRLGIFYSNVQAFDGDRLAMTLKKEHPDWVSRWIDGTVISTLMKETDNAIENKLNYAFETLFYFIGFYLIFTTAAPPIDAALPATMFD